MVLYILLRNRLNRNHEDVWGIVTRERSLSPFTHDVFVSDEAEKAYYEILKIQSTMKPLLKEMSIYIQDNFEIDVEHTSRAFIKSLENKEL